MKARFNGQAILERYVRTYGGAYYNPASGTYVGYSSYAVGIEGQRLPFFQSAYDSLNASVYQGLYLQTAGKALLDQAELVVDDKGLRLGSDALNNTLAASAQSDPANAAVNLAEFIYFAGDSLAGSGVKSMLRCRRWNKPIATTTGAFYAHSTRSGGRYN